MSHDELLIIKAVEAMSSADAILVTAGAGMSVDSGLPDYRGTEGFWNHYPVYRDLRADYAAMTRPSGFARDPAFAWGFYGHRLHLYREARPHRGYTALSKICQTYPDRHFVLTSNVDGLFLKAGFSETSLRECHGSIHRLQCIHPCRRETWPSDGCEIEVATETMLAREPLPRCKFCGGLARPALFAFGDTAYVWESTQEQADRYQEWRARMRGSKLAVIECGVGPTVPGLRREGQQAARESGGTLLRINPGDSSIDHPDDLSIAMGAEEALLLIQAGLEHA